MATEPPRLDIFVYGTLKRGQRNHERYCRGALEIKEARAHGRLYNLPYSFPGLIVPEESVLATGTTDYLADAEKQHRAFSVPEAHSRTWDTVHGELMTFDDPEKRLPALDALEGYVSGGAGLYERVLVPIEVACEVALAWTYRMARAAGVYLSGGCWPAE